MDDIAERLNRVIGDDGAKRALVATDLREAVTTIATIIGRRFFLYPDGYAKGGFHIHKWWPLTWDDDVAPTTDREE